MTRASRHLGPALLLTLAACGNENANSGAAPEPTVAPAAAAIAPAPKQEDAFPIDPNNIVNIAVNSKDHTTLVAALKAADYVVPVANPGPLTVFAPTNAAFEKLPAGTVETLVKPENKEKLQDILKYHVTTSTWQVSYLKDGQELGMANGKKVKVAVKDGAVTINGAAIVASVPASNGIVHVVDGVLLPPEG